MRKIITMAVCLALGLSLRAGNRDDAELKFKGIGDFNDPALHSSIIGYYQEDGSAAPGIILLTDRLYGSRCLYYEFVTFENGIPVFRQSYELNIPKDARTSDILFKQKGKDLFFFWTQNEVLNCVKYNIKNGSCKDIASMKMPVRTGLKAIEFEESGSLEVYYAMNDKVSTRPGDWRSAEYRPYDGAGVYRGGLSAQSLWHFSYPSLGAEPSSPERITEKEAITGSVKGLDVMEIEGQKGLVAGTREGGFYFFRFKENGKTDRIRIVDNRGNAMRHTTISPNPSVYPAGNRNDLLISCEGGVFFLRYTGKTCSDGRFIYEYPVNAKEVTPALNAGSLVTPTVVDWDNDGYLDIVVGNSAGHILFFRNVGTDEDPDFLKAQYLKAGGRIIHVQPGYGEDVQGPGESRWGYIGANVYDWNNDGFLDILTNDSRGKHMIYIGTSGGLKPEHPLYLGDLPLHGTWRCRPGVGVLDGKTVYITLDDDDEFHLYFREDDYNLLDGGKLLLDDGRSIRANWLEAGGKGRVRFEVVDWDGDGVKDLIVSTNKHNKIPAQDKDGLPWSRPDSLKAATILFMRNVGTESGPKFEKPKQLMYKGELLRLGHHGCCGSACFMGHITDNLPNIVAGDETGTLYLFERKYITW